MRYRHAPLTLPCIECLEDRQVFNVAQVLGVGGLLPSVSANITVETPAVVVQLSLTRGVESQQAGPGNSHGAVVIVDVVSARAAASIGSTPSDPIPGPAPVVDVPPVVGTTPPVWPPVINPIPEPSGGTPTVPASAAPVILASTSLPRLDSFAQTQSPPIPIDTTTIALSAGAGEALRARFAVEVATPGQPQEKVSPETGTVGGVSIQDDESEDDDDLDLMPVTTSGSDDAILAADGAASNVNAQAGIPQASLAEVLAAGVPFDVLYGDAGDGRVPETTPTREQPSDELPATPWITAAIVTAAAGGLGRRRGVRSGASAALLRPAFPDRKE